jgi:uncharacterized glyoxalase superfamily protein PhnB
MAHDRIVPMLHVADVAASVRWYQAIGFELRATHEEGGSAMDWAKLTFGESELMLTSGGTPPSQPRREADLYIYVEDLVGLHQRIASKVEVVEDLHDTFYGMQELIVRDPNGFWLTFARPAESRSS